MVIQMVESGIEDGRTCGLLSAQLLSVTNIAMLQSHYIFLYSQTPLMGIKYSAIRWSLGNQISMLVTPVKAFIKSSLAALRLELRRINPAPPPAPVYEKLGEAWKARNIGDRSAYLCPLSSLRTFNGLAFSEDAWHPFVAATKEYMSPNGVTRYAGSILEAYYNTWQPRNALEALIGTKEGPRLLTKLQAYTSHLPWMDVSPEEREAAMAKIIRNENRWTGKVELDASEGYGLQGPVSKTKGEIEYARLARTVDSIKQHGFDRTRAGEDITVTAVERYGDYRFCISHGQHRAAVLAALGYNHVPVSLIKIVSLDEIDHWPQIYRGNWSKSEAIQYVNHLFDFDAKGWARKMGLLKN